MKISIKRKKVLIIPGLSDKGNWVKLATSWWSYYGIDTYIHSVGWQDNNSIGSFSKALDSIIKISKNLADRDPITIVGISAGGSAAFNTLLEIPSSVDRAISICGRLRKGNHQRRSLEKRSEKSIKFKESVLQFENQEPLIPADFRKRFMTVSAKFGDELVPSDTSFLAGAYNLQIPTIEHLLSISLGLIIFSKSILNFIRFGKP